jgi:hypothetical protein
MGGRAQDSWEGGILDHLGLTGQYFAFVDAG